MAGTNPTFGCGAFLPGYGPFNFPDYDPNNGNTKGPNGGSNDPAGPPVSDPSGGGDPEPECACRADSVFTVVMGGGVLGPGGEQPPPGFVYYTLTCEQRCKQIINGLPADDSATVIRNMRGAATAPDPIFGQPGIIVFDNTNIAAGACEGEGSPTAEDPCREKRCPDLVIVYKVRVPRDLSGPPTPTGGGTVPGTLGPSRAKSCRCVIDPDRLPPVSSTTTEGNIETTTWTWYMKCVDIIANRPAKTNREIVSEFILQNRPPGASNISPLPPKWGGVCGGGPPNAPNCNLGPPCPDVTASWQREIEGGGTIGVTPIGEQPEADPGLVGEDPNDPPGGGVTSVDDQPDVGPPGNIGEDPGDPTGPGATRIEDQTEGGIPGLVEGGGGGGSGTPIEDQAIIGDPIAPQNRQSGGFNYLANTRRTSEEAVNNYFASRAINLSDPLIERTLLASSPTGFQDPEVIVSTQSNFSRLVPNTAEKGKLIFADEIDSTLLYLLTTGVNSQNWDSSKASGFSTESILRSLKPSIRDIVTNIKTYSGSLLTYDQIFSLLGSRVLDDTIDSVTPEFLQKLSETSNNRENYSIVRSRNNTVNEIAALRLIESNYFSLDPTQADGVARNTLTSYKSLSSDIDRYIEVVVGGEVQKYYVNDDDTFVRRSSLSLEDGEFFDVTLGGETTRVFAQSEIDHAFLVPENVRQTAINILGGDTNTLLTVSALATDNIETSYSLSSPRENFYFLSCVLDTIKSEPKIGQSRLLSRTEADFRYVPIESSEDLNKVNEFIKFKSNHEVYVLNEEDLLIDYMLSGSLVTLKQDDVLYEAPKENKSNPILVRQLPRYIIFYPTNREDFLVFNDKSTIIEVDSSAVNFDGDITSSGLITRQLVTNISIAPTFNKPFNSQFISTQTAGKEATDVLGNPDTQTRIQVLNPDSTVYKEGFRTNESVRRNIESKLAKRIRKKTGIRLATEILNEMDNNYSLGKNGVGKSVTEFDLFSRFNIREFNTFIRSSDYQEIKKYLFSGSVRDVKVVPAIKNADDKLSLRKTQLILRKNNAPDDTFLPTKTTSSGRILLPPTEEEPAREVPPPADSPRQVTP